MTDDQRRKLPIGIQTFSDISEGNYYYVDKAPHIERLVAAKHRASGKPIHLIGVAFSSVERLIVAFEVESFA